MSKNCIKCGKKLSLIGNMETKDGLICKSCAKVYKDVLRNDNIAFAEKTLEELDAHIEVKRKSSNKALVITAVGVVAAIVVMGVIGYLTHDEEKGINKAQTEAENTKQEAETATEDRDAEKEIDIISDEGHAVFFGGTGSSDWSGNYGVVIDSYAYIDSPKISVMTRGDTGEIRDIWICLENFTDRKDEYSTVDSAIELAKEYTDMDHLKEKFVFKDSWCLISESNHNKEYMIHYKAKDTNSDGDKPEDYVLTITTDRYDYVTDVSINDTLDKFDSPDGMKDNPNNSYELEEWDEKL